MMHFSYYKLEKLGKNRKKKENYQRVLPKN